MSTSTTALLKWAHGAPAAGAQGNVGAVASWLFVCCALIFLMVVIGGITRLTLSGLSITEWKPVVGVLPPFSSADWAAEFAKYKQFPEYRLVHYAMSLDEFVRLFCVSFGTANRCHVGTLGRGALRIVCRKTSAVVSNTTAPA